MPQISVIVPVYNVEEYIHRCVDSILAQTFRDFELILVDDGSPDNCGVICDEYAAKDSRVVVIHQENGGISAARNAGIKWARENSDSEWISLIDSDDWVHTTFLDKLLSSARVYNTRISCCEFCRIGDNEVAPIVTQCKPCLCLPEDIYCDHNNGGVLAYPWRFLYYKGLFTSIEYPCGKIFEDLFTTHKLIFGKQKIAYVEEQLYFYFIRNDSLSHSVWSPKQLDRIEGYEEVIAYSESSKNLRVQLCAKRGYLFAIHDNYRQVVSSICIEQSEKKFFRKLLKCKMRKALHLYASQTNIHFSTDGWLYAVAYPKLMNMYWFLCGVLRKFYG